MGIHYFHQGGNFQAYLNLLFKKNEVLFVKWLFNIRFVLLIPNLAEIIKLTDLVGILGSYWCGFFSQLKRKLIFFVLSADVQQYNKKLVLLLCKFCLFTDIILFFFAHIVNVWTSHQHCCCAAEAISQLVVILFILELHWRRLDWCTISVTSAPACPHWRLWCHYS